MDGTLVVLHLFVAIQFTVSQSGIIDGCRSPTKTTDTD